MAWQKTIVTMIERAQAGDNKAWKTFYQVYQPLVWLRGKDYELNETEQAELLSAVMLAFWKARDSFHYDPSKGRFQDYFRSIINSCLFKLLRDRGKMKADEEVEELSETLPDERDSQEDWDWKAAVFNRALEQIKVEKESQKVQAFVMCRLKQTMTPQEMAKLLGVSQATVYNYCKEVFERLQELVQEYVRTFED